MTKPLDEDLRVRVVGAVREGMSRHASAARFGVSISSAIRWAKLAEETGSVKAKPMGGDRHSKLLEHRDFLLELASAEPDLTLTGDPRPAGPAPDHRGPCEGVAVLCQREDQLQKNAARRRAGR